MLTSYCPEMHEPKPVAQIEAQLGHYGKHWYLKTPLELSGRGITFLKKCTAENLVPGSHQVGWNSYRVTDAAFEKICQQYAVSTESYL